MVISLNQKGLLGTIVLFATLSGLILGGIFIAINLPNSIPGDLIYPIKGIYENLRLAFNELSSESRAEIFADLSNSRLKEFEKLINKREYGRVQQTLERMVLMQKKALDEFAHSKNRGTNITAGLSRLKVNLEEQKNTLKKLYFEASPENYDFMDKAIQSTEENLDRTEMM